MARSKCFFTHPTVATTFFLWLLLISSCARYPTYTQPNRYLTQQEKYARTINKRFNEVWTALIDYSAGTFFAIDNYEKDSGLLTLSFGADNPSDYVDCGHIKTVTIKFDGPVIEACEFHGDADLDGSMNIFVKPILSNVTQVKINARYVLKLFDGAARQTWAFDSGGSDAKRFSGIQENVVCVPTNKAETTILDGIEKIAKGIEPQ